MPIADPLRYTIPNQRHDAVVIDFDKTPNNASRTSGPNESTDASHAMSDQTQSEDVALMQRIIARDEDALHLLHRKYHALVLNMALYILKDQGMAEEIAQDIFLAVWQQPQKWEPERGRLTSWLLSITRYTAIDRLRYEKRRPPMLESPLDSISHMMPVGGLRDDHLRDSIGTLRTLVKKLPIEQQRVIYLAYFHGMTHSEIADQLSIPVGTVKSRLRLGLKRLKDAWQEVTGNPLPRLQP